MTKKRVCNGKFAKKVQKLPPFLMMPLLNFEIIFFTQIFDMVQLEWLVFSKVQLLTAFVSINWSRKRVRQVSAKCQRNITETFVTIHQVNVHQKFPKLCCCDTWLDNTTIYESASHGLHRWHTNFRKLFSLIQ